jgi:hypothetical protein
MKIKLLLASVLVLVLAACGGGASDAKKKDAAASTGKVFKVLQGALLSGTGRPLAPQAVVVEPLVVQCDTGSISYTFTSTETSFTYGISTPAAGCIEAGVKLVATNFTMAYSFTEVGNQFTYSVTFNGSITVTSGNDTDSVTFNNFSFTIRVNGNTTTLILNGSVTSNGEVVTFNNESYSYADLGI